MRLPDTRGQRNARRFVHFVFRALRKIPADISYIQGTRNALHSLLYYGARINISKISRREIGERPKWCLLLLSFFFRFPQWHSSREMKTGESRVWKSRRTKRARASASASSVTLERSRSRGRCNYNRFDRKGPAVSHPAI